MTFGTCSTIDKGVQGQAPYQLSSNQGVISFSDIAFHDIFLVSRHLKKILQSVLTSAKRIESSNCIRTEEIAYMLRSIAQETNQPIRVKTHINIMSTNNMPLIPFDLF